MDITQRQITKIAREVNRFTVRTLKSDGIGSSELDLIHTIRKHPGITQAKACAVLGADKGAVAKQCASLEAKGYIERKENPDDGQTETPENPDGGSEGETPEAPGETFRRFRKRM